MGEKKKNDWRPWIAIGAALWSLALLIPIMSGGKQSPQSLESKRIEAEADARAAQSGYTKQDPPPPGYYRNGANELVKNPTPEELASYQALTAKNYAPTPEKPASDWYYTRDTDEMSGKERVFACTTSSNQVQLKWPYKTQHVELCVRKHPSKGTDVYIRLEDDGQFMCPSYDGCTIRIRFDEAEASAYSALASDSGATDVIFVANAKRFIGAVSSAKKARIEAKFYEVGSQVMVFDVANLDWPNGGR